MTNHPKQEGPGRPPRVPREDYALVYAITRNPYVDLHDVASQYDLPYSTVKKIQRAQYPFVNKLMLEDYGITAVRVDGFTKYRHKGFGANPELSLGRTFVHQPCPPRYQAERLLKDMLQSRDRDARLVSEERYSRDSMSIDQFKNR